jgi:hypothetical protein
MYLLVCLWQPTGHMCVIWRRYPKRCGTQWHSGLRHFATSRKVAGSIPHGIIGIFHSFPPHCGSGVDSASNRNEYQESLLEGKSGRCVGLTILPLSCADCLRSSGGLNLWCFSFIRNDVLMSMAAFYTWKYVHVKEMWHFHSHRTYLAIQSEAVPY